MRVRTHLICAVALLACLWLGACGASNQPGAVTPENTTGVDLSAIYTQAAHTLIAQLTREAVLQTATPAPPLQESPSFPVTGPTETASPTVELAPTAVLVPTYTDTPQPTFTPLPTPTATLTPVPCDLAEFVADLSTLENAVLIPSTTFIKTWRIRNTGLCTWTPEYRLVFDSGFPLDNRTSVRIPVFVPPGQTIDISVELVTPAQSGTYRGYWFMRNSEGRLFGLGPNGEDPFWVQFNVVEPINDFEFDFAYNYCYADWRSGAALLPCPGSVGSDVGFVSLLEYPSLETREEDERALWLRPNLSPTGWISGTYPPLRMRSGDHFIAEIGCMSDSEGCDVTFQLDYSIPGGVVRNLGVWRESYDGFGTLIDLDLSALAGQSVQFTMSVIVQNNLPERANAFWFVPRIQR